jgi:hypothetical protein
MIGVRIFLSRQMQGAGGKTLGFGKSRAKLLTEAHGRVTFEDVAGVDEAKQDLTDCSAHEGRSTSREFSSRADVYWRLGSCTG